MNFITGLIVIVLVEAQVYHSQKPNGENDPFEGANRNIFKFNEKLDDYFFKPVAKVGENS